MYMKQNEKQQVGVWIDNQETILITNSTGPESKEYTIHGKIKASGSHSGGSEHNMNNAKHADAIKYYKAVSAQLLNFDEILIFGPGQSQEQLQNHLHEDAQFKSKKISIDTADQLTDPQMIAKVRDFFKA
jgi:stalled ribosome rescue protein Dom34